MQFDSVHAGVVERADQVVAFAVELVAPLQELRIDLEFSIFFRDDIHLELSVVGDFALPEE